MVKSGCTRAKRLPGEYCQRPCCEKEPNVPEEPLKQDNAVRLPHVGSGAMDIKSRPCCGQLGSPLFWRTFAYTCDLMDCLSYSLMELGIAASGFGLSH